MSCSWQLKECPEKKRKENFGRAIRVWARHDQKSKFQKFRNFSEPKLFYLAKRFILNPNRQKKIIKKSILATSLTLHDHILPNLKENNQMQILST